MENLFTQNQHFVPESYLKQFTTNRSGFFYRLKISNELLELREVHVSKVCFNKNFYDIDNLEQMKGLGISNRRFIEASFKYENSLAEILNKLRSHHWYLSRKEFELLVDAYVSIKQRGTKYRKEVQKLQDEGIVFDNITRSLKNELSSLIADHNFDYDRFVSNYKTVLQADTSYPRSMHLRSLIETSMNTNAPVTDAVTKILSMNMVVLEAQGDDDYLFTTDNPGYSLLDNRMFNTNYGAFDKIIWPINSKQAIQLERFDPLNYIRPLIRVQYYKIDSNHVNEINKMLFMVADENIFCENRSYLERFKASCVALKREQESLIDKFKTQTLQQL